MNVWLRVRGIASRTLLRLVRLPWRTGAALGLLVGGGYMATLYGQTRAAVRIQVNGVDLVHYTQRSAADDIFDELGVVLAEADAVVLPTDDELRSGDAIRLVIARPVRVIHDGRVSEVYTSDGDLAGALAEKGIVLHRGDQLWTDDGPVAADHRLSDVPRPERMSLSSWIEQIRVPVYVSVRRAVSITISDGRIPCTLTTTADSVSEALSQAGIDVYEGDRVVPSLDSRVMPDLQVEILRARSVAVDADGQLRVYRTRAQTVAQLLGETGIALEGEDRVSPGLTAPIVDGLSLSVVRVYDEYYVEEVPIPYETRWDPNPELEIDQRRTANWGREGAMRQQVRVHFENGIEVSRAEEEAWVAREPEARVIEYGTGIVVRQVDTPSGPVEYWRKLRMLATSYNAATAGKPASSSTYGITRLGEPARKGVIAVDPSVVALRQPMYVPGYGLGFAGDTGSAIQNRRIDLCFDDHNLEMWYRWVDVYLLTPVPPASQIAWIVPNLPVERE